MRATISFSRKIDNFKQDLPNLTFVEGDVYDIYHHLIRSKGLEVDTERTLRYGGFKIILITQTAVKMEKLAPPFGDYKLKTGETIELDFFMYGNYSITLTRIENQ